MKTTKTSTKSSKVSEAAIAPKSEQALTEQKPVTRAAKSSPAVPSAPKTTSHRHSKLTAPATAVEEGAIHVVAAPATAPTAAPSRAEIACVAHAFWVERNFAHGSAEEDWLRAEQALAARN